MHAMMRELAEAAGLPDHDAYSPSRLPFACEISERAVVGPCRFAQGCPACTLAFHAFAMRSPNALILHEAEGTRRTARRAMNTRILAAGYPLPLIPAPS